MRSRNAALFCGRGGGLRRVHGRLGFAALPCTLEAKSSSGKAATRAVSLISCGVGYAARGSPAFPGRRASGRRFQAQGPQPHRHRGPPSPVAGWVCSAPSDIRSPFRVTTQMSGSTRHPSQSLLRPLGQRTRISRVVKNPSDHDTRRVGETEQDAAGRGGPAPQLGRKLGTLASDPRMGKQMPRFAVDPVDHPIGRLLIVLRDEKSGFEQIVLGAACVAQCRHQAADLRPASAARPRCLIDATLTWRTRPARMSATPCSMSA